jgi:hypothetical protein
MTAKQDPTGPANPKAANLHGADEVQAIVDHDEAQGFKGITTDPTPNYNYTVQGVTKGLPTPETSDEQYSIAQAHGRKVARGMGITAA